MSAISVVLACVALGINYPESGTPDSRSPEAPQKANWKKYQTRTPRALSQFKLNGTV